MIEKELETILQQRDNLKLDIEQMAKKGDKLNQLHQKRDEILGKWTNIVTRYDQLIA